MTKTLLGVCVSSARHNSAVSASPKLALIADFATLTGALGLACRNQQWRAHRCFPYPEDYDSHLDSTVADVKQCSLECEADHILAILFLMRFVDDTPWLPWICRAIATKAGWVRS